MAENVVRTIASLVKERQIPCFCSLHQPRSSIWRMLDSVILMAPGGRVCYSGKREDSLSYFSSLGYTCPSETNPAEYFIDLVSVDLEDPVQALKDEARIEALTNAFLKRQQQQRQRQPTMTNPASMEFQVEPCSNSGITKHIPEVSTLKAIISPGRVIRVIRRFGALLKRSWRQNLRLTNLNVFRLVTSLGTALLLSQIFPTVAPGIDPKPKSVADRVALLSFGKFDECIC